MKNKSNIVETNVSTKKSVGYIRISKENLEGISLENQKSKILQYVELNDMPINHIYCDVCSGKSIVNRVEFQKMLADLDNIKNICVYKLDRLSRKSLDILQLIEDFDKRDIAFHSVQEKLDSASPIGRFVIRTLSSLAEMERDVLSFRTKDALAKVREKKPLGGVGFGKEACFKDDKRVSFEENSGESKVLVKILELRSEGLTLKKIKEYLERNQIKTKKGCLKWRESVIHRIIKRNT